MQRFTLDVVIIRNFKKVFIITKCITFAWKLVHTRFVVLFESIHAGFPNVRFFLERTLVDVCYGEEAMYAAAERGIMKLYLAEDGCDGAADNANIRAARAAVRAALPHLQMTKSAPGNIEITPENAGKGTALAYLAQYLGLEREQVMAMGDAENDLSMLEYAEHSVAMANASDEVKATCRYQTASNDDCGVAAMIDRVLAAKETI